MDRNQATWAALALVLLTLTGCRCCYPVPWEPIPSTCKACAPQVGELTPEWAIVPQCSKNHVHIYLLNGNDPLNNGNLLGARDYLHARGFIKTSYGQQFHGPWFESEIRDIAAADPTARFVLVGFSAAAGPTNGLARRLTADGVHVDRLVYIDGALLFKDSDVVKPEKVTKWVNFHGDGHLVRPRPFDTAENVHVEGAWHFDMPTHPTVLKRILAEVTEVAAQVPYSIEVPELPCTGPKPTPCYQTKPPAVPPGWDFLRHDPEGVPVTTSSFKPVQPAPKP